MECGILLGFLFLAALVVLFVAAAQQKSGQDQTQPPNRTRPDRSTSGQTHYLSRPARPSRTPSTPEQCWVGPGGSTAVHDYRLDGGMIYVGRDLPSVDRRWNDQEEPALIRPDLFVARSTPDWEGSSIGYWPSYQEISASARAAYLAWLANGRRAPDAYIGYVFLFFYGIERRVLADAQTSAAAREEIPALLREVEELLEVYGDDNSFGGYARSFLQVARLLHRSVPLSELEPPLDSRSYDVPLTTKLALGVFAEQGDPVPVEWALSWVLCSSAFRFRTPAQRCPEELRRLFELRYPEHFRKGGLVIKPNKTRLSATYHPASPSFGRGGIDLDVPDLPDVTILKGPTRKLQELVDEVTDELDPYSRWIGRNDDRDSPAAVALLPPELAVDRESPETAAFEATLREALGEEDWAVVEADDLVAAWPSKKSDKLTKRESEMLARFLEPRGFGIEPDPRFGGPALGHTEKAILFDLQDAAAPGQDGHSDTPSSGYTAAALLLHLAAAVAGADGEVAADEERHLEEHLEQGMELDGAERQRLRHHLRWLLADPPGMAGVKKRLEALGGEERHLAGRFLITVAGADGRIDPEELKILRKIYPLLGLDAEEVYSDVHALRAGGVPGDEDEPVTVVSGAPPRGYEIPPEQEGDGAGREGFTLDRNKLDKMRSENTKVVELLTEVFEDEEEAPEPTAPPPEPEDGSSLFGLDAAHSAFLRELTESTTWERLEIERLAERLGVFPDGALELINEKALELCGDPLLEGDELVEIDVEILQEMAETREMTE